MPFPLGDQSPSSKNFQVCCLEDPHFQQEGVRVSCVLPEW